MFRAFDYYFGYKISGSFGKIAIFVTSNAIYICPFLLLTKKKKKKKKKEKKKRKEREVANKMGSVEAFCNKLVWFLFRGFCEIVARFASLCEVVILVLIVEVFLLPSL